MDSRLNVWIRRLGIPLLVAIIAIFLLPHSGQIVAPLLSLGIWIAAALGYIFIFAGIPFLLWLVARTCFRTFAMPYLRSRRIRVIREKRLLAEAAARTGSEQR